MKKTFCIILLLVFSFRGTAATFSDKQAFFPAILWFLAGLTATDVALAGGTAAVGTGIVYYTYKHPLPPINLTRPASPNEVPDIPDWQPGDPSPKPGFNAELILRFLGSALDLVAIAQQTNLNRTLEQQLEDMYANDPAFTDHINQMQTELDQKGYLIVPGETKRGITYRIVSPATYLLTEEAFVYYEYSSQGKTWTRRSLMKNGGVFSMTQKPPNAAEIVAEVENDLNEILRKATGYEVLTLEEITRVLMTPGYLKYLDEHCEYGFGVSYQVEKWFKSQCGCDRIGGIKLDKNRIIVVQTHMFKQIDGLWSFRIEIFSKTSTANLSENLKRENLSFQKATEWLEKISTKINEAVRNNKLPSGIPNFFDDLR